MPVAAKKARTAIIGVDDGASSLPRRQNGGHIPDGSHPELGVPLWQMSGEFVAARPGD